MKPVRYKIAESVFFLNYPPFRAGIHDYYNFSNEQPNTSVVQFAWVFDIFFLNNYYFLPIKLQKYELNHIYKKNEFI